MTFKVGATAALAPGLNAAFDAAFTRAKSNAEKTHVKTLASTAFLDHFQTELNQQLAPGWCAKVAAAYVDTHPRVIFKTGGTKKEIEIGDIMFVKTVHSRGARPRRGRAWLVQAKRSEDDPLGPPPITSAKQGKDQLEFSKDWPRFTLPISGAKYDVRKGSFPLTAPFEALEWWACVWGTASQPPPTGSPWNALRWVACDAVGGSYTGFGNALAMFATDSSQVGRNYVYMKDPAADVGGWSELISALLDYCRYRAVRTGEKGLPSNALQPRIAVSSRVLHWSQAPRHDALVSIARHEESNAFGFANTFDGDVSRIAEADPEGSGFLLIHIYIAQVGG